MTSEGLLERVNGLYLTPLELEVVLEILGKFVADRGVWAFGSRATGVRLKRFSDLDLALEGRLTAHESNGLADAFDESVLPFKVDLLELDTATPEFRSRIERDFVPLLLADRRLIQGS